VFLPLPLPLAPFDFSLKVMQPPHCCVILVTFVPGLAEFFILSWDIHRLSQLWSPPLREWAADFRHRFLLIPSIWTFTVSQVLAPISA
jgi:hypothetical protein